MLSYLLYNEGENGVSGGKIMKKRFIIYTLIVSLLLQFIPSLNLLKAVEARNDLSNSSIVNSVTISPSTVNNGDDVVVSVDFSEKSGQNIHPGDTIHMKLPNNEKGSLKAYTNTMKLRTVQV